MLKMANTLEDLSIPKDAIQKLEISQGEKSRSLLGVGLGFLAGAGLGVAYGAAGHPGLPHVGSDLPPEMEYVVPFTLGGVILGGILGANVKSEKWQTVTLP